MASSVEDNISSNHENGLEDKNGDCTITDIDTLKNECLKWKSKSEKLQTELDDTKSEVTVANCIKVRIYNTKIIMYNRAIYQRKSRVNF